MNLNFIKRWAARLLPLIVLHALVPAGFMFRVDQHGPQLIFCPGVVQRGGDHLVDQHSLSREHLHDASHQGSSHESSACPFALIGATNCHALPYITVDLTVTDESLTLAWMPFIRNGLIRAHRIRGPPGHFLKH